MKIYFFLLTLFFFIGCTSYDNILEEDFHENGKTKRIKSEGLSDEGLFIREQQFDTIGRLLLEFGIKDGTRYEELNTYLNGVLYSKIYYWRHKDSTFKPFTTEEMMFTETRKITYYKNGKRKTYYDLSYYEDWNTPDTSRIINKKFDSTGALLSGIEIRNHRKDIDSNTIEEFHLRTNLVSKEIDTIWIRKIKSKSQNELTKKRN